MTREINLNHICKIEGHAHLNLKIDKNQVKVCELKAAEGARFFEALVLGKKIEDIQEIVSRICGICSSAHTVSCVQALEEALGIKPSEQQKIIRELLMIGERIRSNATHLYFLSLPDYYGYESALEMSKKHQDKINDSIALISLGNKIIEFFGGREIHPFLSIKEKIPQKDKNYEEILTKLEQSKPLIKKTITLFSNLNYPDFERPTDYLSLRDNNYATISGKVCSASRLIEDNDYKNHLKEGINEYSTSKFVLKNNKPYMVGALARLNNNYDRLDNETKKFTKNLKFPINNPFQNNTAQTIEIMHLTNKAIELIRKISQDITGSKIKIQQGYGVSAVEAPRGTLFHEYKINKTGRIEYCNIITPTAQNLAMIEYDIKSLTEKLLTENKNLTNNKLILKIEKLIRAYDPCFSCSTHFLKVNWL